MVDFNGNSSGLLMPTTGYEKSRQHLVTIYGPSVADGSLVLQRYFSLRRASGTGFDI
jgi:hypothetical protein